MSIKAKVTSLLMMFIICVGLVLVGVFAATQENFKVGGNFNFDANGVDATISLEGELTGCELTNDDSENKFKTITINDNMSKSQVVSQFSSWSGLKLHFLEGETTATLKIKVQNVSQEANN